MHVQIPCFWHNRISISQGVSFGFARTDSLMLWLQEYMKTHGLHVPIEVETRTLQEVLEVKELIETDRSLRIDRVMLDNMTRLDSSLEGQCALCTEPWSSLLLRAQPQLRHPRCGCLVDLALQAMHCWQCCQRLLLTHAGRC